MAQQKNLEDQQLEQQFEKETKSSKPPAKQPAKPEQAVDQATFDAILDRPVKYIVAGTDREITLTPRQVEQYLCVRTKSGKTASKDDIVKFLKLCEARGLDPWVGDAYLVGYDTKDGPVYSLITSEQALLKRAEAHPQYDGIASGVIVWTKSQGLTERQGEIVLQGEQLIGAWAAVDRKDRAKPSYRAINLKNYHKNFGVWQTNPEGMIGKCARAAALREAFPNTLGGLHVREELSEQVDFESRKESKPKLKSLEGVVEELEVAGSSTDAA